MFCNSHYSVYSSTISSGSNKNCKLLQLNVSSWEYLQHLMYIINLLLKVNILSLHVVLTLLQKTEVYGLKNSPTGWWKVIASPFLHKEKNLHFKSLRTFIFVTYNWSQKWVHSIWHISNRRMTCDLFPFTHIRTRYMILTRILRAHLPSYLFISFGWSLMNILPTWSCIIQPH